MGHPESPWRRALPAEQTRHPEGSFEGHLAQDPGVTKTARSFIGGIPPCQNPFEARHGVGTVRRSSEKPTEKREGVILRQSPKGFWLRIPSGKN